MGTSTSSSSIATALERIPPLWPLTNFVAVNPFAGLVQESFAEACALLERTAGAAPLPCAQLYRGLYARGELTDADLDALAPPGISSRDLHRALNAPTLPVGPVRLLSEYVDEVEARARWAPFFIEEISRWCGAHFDRNQTTWTSPWRGLGLFSGWRDAATHDCNPEVFGVTDFRATVRALPDEPATVVTEALTALQVPAHLHTDLLHRAALSIAGWMGHVRYLQHQARLRDGDSALPQELLAIRLAYELALLRSGRVHATDVEAWHRAVAREGRRTDVDTRVVWQKAYEHHYQRDLAAQLCAERSQPSVPHAIAQAVFCIDVRSEPMRRHLEIVAPAVQTIGFAGFFGFALAHPSVDKASATARCPVLLAPSITVNEVGGDEARQRESSAIATAALAFQNAAPSTFSFVESIGVAFAPALIGSRGRPARQCQRTDLKVDEAPAALQQLADTAAHALAGMGLTHDFARMVLFCGHGSRSSNNPFASSLDCGACGGHAGDVNARFAARVLNHRGIRGHLATKGIVIPDDTVFAAALHDTLADTLRFLEPERIPSTHRADLELVSTAFHAASEAVRRERATALPAGRTTPSMPELECRAFDASEVRPEWGLANNAAILLAPRARSRGLNLQGRVFLQDYVAAEDPDGALLAALLAAPVVVASWINLQYYASRLDPARYGAGRKILHNVVGGIGVLEGNGGDLRVGLPWESLHDGEQFRHEPRRLSVFVEASRSQLMRALSAKPDVRRLFDNEWIHLVAIEADCCHRYSVDGWTPLHRGSAAESRTDSRPHGANLEQTPGAASGCWGTGRHND